MKIRGVIRGQTIKLQSATDLPDGQLVEVEIRAAAGQATEIDARASHQPRVVEAADDLRRRIAERVGGNLNSTVQYIREDRDR